MKKNRHVIRKVFPDSIAEEMELVPGDELISINGQPIEDVFDYHYLVNDEYLEILVRKADGEEWELEIEKDFEEDLGVEFENSLMDEYRSCRNHCIFCFIDQMPPGMRETLYFKDDDSRLSFLQGNYVTLTNMSDHDIDRVIRYHLAPINISFQTTNPKLRCEMLHNRFAGDIFPKVDRLFQAGIEMNGQVVLCKGVNDGEELERTIRDLSGYLPHLKSVSVVPVGLSKYREGLHPLEPFNREDALGVLETVHRWQKKLYEQYGLHFIHCSDEWYILAGLPLPEEERYDGYLQLENGVGMLRLLEEEVQEELAHRKGDERVRRVSIATGKLAAPFIQENVERVRTVYGNVEAQVYPIRNDFFGELITVSGLITGQDLKEQLKGKDLGECLLIPCNMLRAGENVFLDDVTVEEVEEQLGVPVAVVDEDGVSFVHALTEKEIVKNHKYMSKPIVAIVGRPNVGKSTLFNVLAGDNISIVKDTPGVTRDRIYADASWLNYNFTLIDTGGIEPESKDVILSQMRDQAQIAIDTADVIVFITDVRQGLVDADSKVADMLRRSGKPVVLAVNKVDSFEKFMPDVYEFYNLGIGDPIPISASGRLGMGDLLDEVVKFFQEDELSEEENEIPRIAIVGKPNVGKSSIVNKLLGQNRVIVSNVAGTTRDAIDTNVMWNGKEYIFIDTAGLRRKNKIKEELERYSIIRTVTAVERADVVIVVIDAEEGITEQDAKIAGIAHERGKGIIIAVNKWDAIEKDDKTIYKYTNKIRETLAYMPYAELLFISAQTGQRLPKLFDTIDMVLENQTLRVQTGVLNEIMTEAVAMQQPPSDKGKRLKLFYITQVAVKPPTFVIFVNDKELMHFSYTRYLENKIRDAFGFRGTSLKFIIRERKGEK